MTPRECFGLLERLNIEKVYETGKEISLSGGDGQDYIDNALIEKVKHEDNDNFETYRSSLSEAINGELHR